MRVRQPNFDFSRVRAHWSPVVEFAQMNNAISVGVPAIERFLNRVMAMARKEIKGTDAKSEQLRADISTFIKQEACHYSMHEQLNAALLRDGYDEIPEIQKEIEAHYARLLETKSLRFLLAYCEGFETIGPASAMAWCGDEFDPYLEGADENIVMMYKWHLLEEFEHRHVCYDTYKRLGGSYFMRIYGFFYQLRCFNKFAALASRHLTRVDRKTMTSEEIERSRERRKAVQKTMKNAVARNLYKVVNPFYKPHILPYPKHWEAVNAAIDRDWQGGRATAA